MCDCIERVSADLQRRDLRLVTLQPMTEALSLLPPRAVLRIEWLSRSRKTLPGLTAAFCPFCGVRYAGEEGEACAR